MRLEEMTGHKFNAPQAADIFDILKKNCNPWITVSKWRPIYRGSKMINPYDDFVKIPVRPDKQDPDIPSTIQIKFDSLLKDKGHAALLSNSVHVTGDVNDAKMYGRVFVIFPIGEYQISWSPNVRGLMGALYRDGKQINKVENLTPTYLDDDLPAAIKSGNEILIKCNEYYKVDLDLWQTISK